ncbi:MAG: maleylpyruvate isomerase N-terminal domain-containing protein [Planctomycetota bacterium]
MNARDALLQRITKRMVHTRELLEEFDDRSAELKRVNTAWNVRDLVAHLAYWTDEGAKQIPVLAAGGKKRDYDIERINDEVFNKNKRMPFLMLLPRLRAAEDGFLAAVRAVEPKLLADDTPVRQWVEGIGVEHYDAHRQSLEEAVGLVS